MQRRKFCNRTPCPVTIEQLAAACQILSFLSVRSDQYLVPCKKEETILPVSLQRRTLTTAEGVNRTNRHGFRAAVARCQAMLRAFARRQGRSQRSQTTNLPTDQNEKPCKFVCGLCRSWRLWRRCGSQRQGVAPAKLHP